MPIQSITVKKVASYDNTGVTLNNIKKLNFFIGFNGTGKSTIAKFLHNVSLPTAEQDAAYSDCSITGYNPTNEKIIVYDERFKKENFIDNDKLKGVFSLNKTNAVIDRKISDYENEIIRIEQRSQDLINRKRNAEQVLSASRQSLVNKAFDLRNKFKKFVKVRFQYGGSRESNYANIERLLSTSLETYTYEEIDAEYNRLFEHELVSIDKTIDNAIWKNIVDSEVALNTILNKIIVGHETIDISGLIKSLNMSSWVDQGRKYLDQSGEVCPFCQQPLENREKLITHMNDFFDESYRKDIQCLADASKSYVTAIDVFKNRLKELRKYPVISSQCDTLLATIADPIEKTNAAIARKQQQPSSIETISTVVGVLDLVDALNKTIEGNNNDASQLGRLQADWKNKCWAFMANEMREGVSLFDKRNAYFNERLKPEYALHEAFLIGKMSFCRAQIETLRQQTVNTKEAVDSINSILKNVGFSDFSIEEVPSATASTQYRLKRLSDVGASNVYQSLSEGEKTFISFLYFYQLCVGTDNMAHSAKKKIIVIDDPISSLDSQTLFIVSSIVLKMAIRKDNANKHQFKDNNISQIFVLTHNLYFYKEVSFDKRPSCADVMHYNVRKDAGCSKIDHSSKQFATDDYSLMWEALKAVKNQTGVDETRNMMVCNTMRRIIDSYVGFIGIAKGNGNPTWASISSLSTTDPTYIVASSFIAQINDDSHGVHVFDNAYYNNIVRQDTSTLFNAFKLIFDEIGVDHYNMMIN